MHHLKNSTNYAQAVEKLTERAKKALLRAEEITLNAGYIQIEPLQLLLAISSEAGSLGKNILLDMGFDEKTLLAFLPKKQIAKKTAAKSRAAISADLKKIFVRAYTIARDNGSPYVGTEHLVYALLESKNSEIKKVFNAAPGINRVEKSRAAEARRANMAMKALLESEHLLSLSAMMNGTAPRAQKKQSGSATPFLEKFCIDINKEAALKKETIIGRKKETERIINILGRKDKNNPLLVGDPGVGKTVLVSGLAQLINSGKVPHLLYKKRILGLDIAQLIAGASFRGEFESRLKEILREVSANKNIILFIDEIHNIVGAGNVAGSLDLANILKPALARGEIRVIGATTFSEFKKYMEKDAALERRFQIVNIKEPGQKETEEILFGIKNLYENFHNVSISDSAINLAVELSARHIQNRFFPDKAIDVIDEAASEIRSQDQVPEYLLLLRNAQEEKKSLEKEKEDMIMNEKFEKAIGLREKEMMLNEKISGLLEIQRSEEKKFRIEITPADIIKTIAEISGIPAEKLSQETSGRAGKIKKSLLSSIIGQDESMNKISAILLRSQLGISDPNRPLGSFLFLGPTGTGKTLTAKTLAAEFFGSPSSLIRIDMSELMERHSISSLIGSPAGYIGYGEGGKLTEKVRRNPYSVVLFDEVEKAHPDVFNIFLQILEDGILTDAEGTTVNFKNTVIIMTSNIGTEEFSAAARVGFSSEKNNATNQIVAEKLESIKAESLKELKNKMRPELINRLDHILFFNPLSEKDLAKIAGIELEKLSKRISQKGILLAFNKAVAEFIAKKSLDPTQGARLVRKNIQELVENPIAEIIMEDRVRNGRIAVSIKQGEMSLI